MLDGTRKFSLVDESNKEMKRTLTTVYDALKEKGYNPINQIVGYLLFFAATAQKQRRSEQGCKEYVVVSFHIFHDWIVLFTTVAECCSSGWLRRRRESRSAGFAGCDGRRLASACSSDRSCRGA